MTIDVRFIDSGREPQCKPDPRYPDGIDLNLAEHVLQKVCGFNVPYPAPRCGQYAIRCKVCNYYALVTVAGRPDDPRTVTMPCRSSGLNG